MSQTVAPGQEPSTSPLERSFLDDVLHGLASRERNIPCKWLYDARGSLLFEEICRTNDYYVTRIELGLLREWARLWASHAGRNTELLEPGAGSGEKAVLLLSQLEAPSGYLPLDISASATELAVRSVARARPNLHIDARQGDFTAPHFEVARLPGSQRRLLFFPGSTIGNFDPGQRAKLLPTFRSWLQPGDLFLVGIDLVKDVRVLERAYDDRDGVTAAFNLNLLGRLQRELNATVDAHRFRHRAVYNEVERRIEMHLVSQWPNTVSIGEHHFRFSTGESIHTENSHKFEVDEFAEEVAGFGFRLIDQRRDAMHYFSHQLFEAT